MQTLVGIVSKAVLSVIGGDIQEAAGSLQLCSGQISGIEAAVHAVNEAYHDADTEAVRSTPLPFTCYHPYQYL